jgi:large subunit ribosomal protein L29
MPNKNMAELANQEISELLVSLAEAKQEAFNLRFRSATGQLESSAKLRDARRRIARINTVLRQREIAAAEGAK